MASADTETIREARELAGTVLEAMSQDSGPAECEPFTGWCVDLARALLAALDVGAAALAALGRAGQLTAVVDDLLDWHEAECGCDRPGNPSACVCWSDWSTMHALAARAAFAGSVAGEEQGQTYGSDPGRASAASTSREGKVER